MGNANMNPYPQTPYPYRTANGDRDGRDGIPAQPPAGVHASGPYVAVAGEPPLWAPWYGIGFGRAITRLLRKTFIFHGRASRGEYWWAWLFCLLVQTGVYLVVTVISWLTGHPSDLMSGTLSEGNTWPDMALLITQLVLWLPNLSLSVRRLHDENLRGWWMLLPVGLQIVAVGAVFVAIFIGGAASGFDSDGPGLAVTVIVAMLLLIGFWLLAALASVVLMVMPGNPKGMRFDRPPTGGPVGERNDMGNGDIHDMGMKEHRA
ncbi:DUF805 domain-containing protein [Bifidobacterium platyrrhinorum]|uniref:DUF805 domain-containing protein n=1 Tax=Bifidobacterium platyrrhinorum TaxID=2661628 RepID=A0A6L9STU5_9BIFI|nr:DUF805 domain-containing protein [Bifidobacterium platyrrhinorum]NEG55894.1 DUF805 domain-containing protein [Bifidobacterium platyrrhinorum]